MQNIRLITFFRVLLITLICTSSAHSEYITQIDIQQAGIVDSVYIKLLENDAPLTVQNFRNYVADRDYSNSFIHRSVSGFIVQGGGFTFDSTLNDGAFSYDAVNEQYLGGLQEVPKDEAVINEFIFSNSNIRGTLAMAKIGARYTDTGEIDGIPCFIEGPDCILVAGTGPDTATSEWFVNLSDNSTNLDTQNGGFTVFAEVLGSGMDVIDGIASQDVFNRPDIHSAFSSIPLLNFISDPVVGDNLVLVKSITEVLSISPDINYGTVTPNTSLQPEIVIQNTGVNSVLIGDIAVQNPLSPPFSIVGDLCSNRELLLGHRCSLIALFSPETSGSFEDSFDIELPKLGIKYQINLVGEGGPDAAEPDITSSFSSIDFGELDVLFSPNGSPYSRQIFINNSGDAQLDFSRIELSTTSDSEFILGGNCLDVNSLATGEFCTIDILYLPLIADSKTAKIVIESNDPDESPFEIPIFAVALPENDGVDSNVENAAPNNGDGNNDNILDSQQSNIVSMPDINGTYITYVSVVSRPFMDTRIVDQSTFNENQDGVNLSAGVHEFTLDNIASDAVIEIGFLLPEGVDPSAYYIYSSTIENSTPHWYQFDFDGETGVIFKGVGEFSSPTGNIIERNIAFLRFKNGGRGDSSNVQDNKIIVKSGINYSSRANDSSDSILSLFILPIIILSLLLMFRRNPR